MFEKKYLPLYYIISIILFPIIFGLMLNLYFALGSIEKIYAFEKIIFSNLKSFKGFKLEVYLSAVFAILPFIIVFIFSIPKNRSTTHGKAKWAKKSDIESYSFSLIKLIKDFFRLLNPLTSPKKFLKNLLEFLKFGMQKKNKMGLNFGNGFILGLWDGILNKKPVCYKEPLCSLIIAPPGAGKSASIAIPNLLHLPTSCIVLDIKGELCDLTAGYRQKALKNKVLIFDPFGKDNTLKFNPFDKKIVKKLDFNAKRKLVDEVAQTIFVEEKGSDPHWINQARNLFIFYALYDLCVYEESNLFRIATATMRDYKPYIYPESPYYSQLWEHDEESGLLILKNDSPIQINSSDPEKLFFKQVSEQIYLDPQDPRNFSQKARDENPDLDEDKPDELKNPKNKRLDEIVRDYARAWSGGSGGDEFSSIKSTFNRVMQVFTSYQVKNCTDGMSFEYEDFRKENITLYIKIAQTDIDTLAPLIRILLESIAKNLLLKESTKPDERVYFILDEFVRFKKLEFLLEMPALCRSYGVVVLFITQSNALIEKYYSDKDAEILGATVNYKIVFKTDHKYAKALSEEIGKYTRKTQSYSTEKGGLIFGGTSTFNQEGKELVSEQYILNLGQDEIIILVKGFQATPVKLITNYYKKDKTMISKINWELKPEKISETENSSSIFDNNKVIPLPTKTINENQPENNEERLIQEKQAISSKNNPIRETEDKELQKTQEEYIREEKAKQLRIEYEYAKLVNSTDDKNIEPPYPIKNKKEYVLEITDKELLVRLLPPNHTKTIESEFLSKLENEPEIQLAKKEGLLVKIQPEG
ncbi:hypothetical protein BKH42_08140 [Helicobacter sp. 13S00482-2]|nr:hypothetical protein BKH42_08140 [Helicobacter sp. 13S00482-2]